MDDNFGQEVLKKIERDEISPEPKWKFLLADYTIWLVATACLLVGSLAVAVIIFIIFNNDWDLYHNATSSFWWFGLTSLPYLWILLLVLFVGLVFHNFRHTKSGYRYRFHSIFIGTIIVSVILGILFYGIGFGRALERALADSLPFYERFSPHHRLWQMAGEGRLGGIITTIDNQGNIRLRDSFGREWHINISQVEVIGDPNFIRPGQRLRVVGRQVDEDEFEALVIKPLFAPPRRQLMMLFR